MLAPGARGGRRARPPAGVSNASLLLERGVFRPLPDVPGALQTVHFRNNNRGQVVGLYADPSGGTPRFRGFLMDGDGDVTRIDVPGALVTNPPGINDRGQVVGSWVGPDAKPSPPTGQLQPAHGFVWEKRRGARTFDVPGATTTAAYEINNRGWVQPDPPLDRAARRPNFRGPTGRSVRPPLQPNPFQTWGTIPATSGDSCWPLTARLVRGAVRWMGELLR